MDLECEGWAKILNVFPDMDFTAELNEKPELAAYLKNAINSQSMGLEQSDDLPECPKMDNDFSRHIIINGLPKCDAKKAAKLTQLLIKLFSKRSFEITEENIQMNYGEDGLTTGQAFIEMKNDESAKIASATFNGHKLDSKHTFSACTFPDFDKIMAFEDKTGKAGTTDYLELNAHALETKNTEFAYQLDK